MENKVSSVEVSFCQTKIKVFIVGVIFSKIGKVSTVGVEAPEPEVADISGVLCKLGIFLFDCDNVTNVPSILYTFLWRPEACLRLRLPGGIFF